MKKINKKIVLVTSFAFIGSSSILVSTGLISNNTSDSNISGLEKNTGYINSVKKSWIISFPNWMKKQIT